jgi:hypothetical protein
MTLGRLAPLALIALLAASCGDSTGQPVLTSQGAYIVVPVNKLQLQ